MNQIDLNGAWTFKAVPADGETSVRHREAARWMAASVPGTVHTDLLAAGVIPNPFYGTNECDVQWVAEHRWMYRKEFAVPVAFLRMQHIVLAADGLDTFARIRCNGEEVGKSANMFIGHRWEIGKLLRPGKNTLEVTFDSPVLRAKKLEKEYGILNVALEPHRVYVRKAQYSFSWDWGPKLTTSGIWRGIRIEGYTGGRLADPFVKVVSVRAHKATVRIAVDVVRYSRAPMQVRILVDGKDFVAERVVPLRGKRVHLTLNIPSPELWWPNGYGGQPMYAAQFTLLQGEEEVDQVRVPFALRTISLLQKRDDEGQSFVLEVNGTRIFCKGANWIPSDSFIPRIPEATYEALLTAARDASMNLIRVWGGGIYEQDVFYDLCDRLGLMVWQDFMYACGEYPAYAQFVREAGREAAEAIKRLRNHPSVALWCGNNECEWLFCTEHPGASPDEMSGSVIFREVLPALVRAYDGTRPYWRSSPYGTGFPNDERSGNHHQWTVWSAWKDYREYENDRGRFVTEFGFQAPAVARTLSDVLPPGERRPQSRGMEHHNKQTEGPERLVRFQAGHVDIGTGFDDFIYKGQFIQAEALKCAVEHWRRRKFKTAGVLFWQLNDCWPVSSWSVIDSALRPKAGYYYARRFYAPVLVSFKRERYGVSVWVTNDRLAPFSGSLHVCVRTVSGGSRALRTLHVEIRANCSRRLELLDQHRLGDIEPSTQYLHALLKEAEITASENRFFFAEPKHMALGQPDLRTGVHGKGASLRVELRSSAFARAVMVEADRGRAVFDDNYFDMEPGEGRTIRLLTEITPEALRRTLRARSL